jgi:hypothetical protein
MLPFGTKSPLSANELTFSPSGEVASGLVMISSASRTVPVASRMMKSPLPIFFISAVLLGQKNKRPIIFMDGHEARNFRMSGKSMRASGGISFGYDIKKKR